MARSQSTANLGSSLELAAGTKERILLTAERLFAEHGIGNVSLRTITKEANVNLAAIHYHFGSKLGLLRPIVERRAKPIAQQRLRLLRECAEAANGSPSLEELLSAFLIPALRASRNPDLGGVNFMRLRARLATEAGELWNRLIGEQFDATSKEFMSALARALPDVSLPVLQWRFHFLLGVMLYTMINPGRIQILTKGACDPSDVETALRQMIPFLAAGFRAPAPPARRNEHRPGPGP